MKIIEVIGPAGAGKSTLVQTICKSNQFKLIRPPYFRSINDFPFFFQNTLLTLPTYVKLLTKCSDKLFTPRQTVWMVTLKGWHRLMQRKLQGSNCHFLLDEGPVFHMSYLYVYGPKVLKSPASKDWWNSMYRYYASTLDLLIWLDAPNPVLTQRIRERSHWHGVKEKSDHQAYQFLDNLRHAYDLVLENLTAQPDHPKIICFDTHQQSIGEIVENVVSVADLNRS